MTPPFNASHPIAPDGDDAAKERFNALLKLTLSDDHAALSLALANGADPNACPERSRSLLSLACSARDSRCAFALIEAGARPEGLSVDQDLCQEPLRGACYRGHAALALALIQAGAPLSFRHPSSLCLIYLCLASPECVAVLINAGAELNSTNSLQQTPLMIAIMRIRNRLDPKDPSYRAAALLVEAGASLTMVDRAGRSPLSLARDSSAPLAIDLLESALERQSLQASIALPERSLPKPRL